jgi:hypothetical protein
LPYTGRLLEVSMMDLLAKYQEAFDENRKLQSRIEELEDKLTINGKLENHFGAYWLQVDETQQFDGPFTHPGKQ